MAVTALGIVLALASTVHSTGECRGFFDCLKGDMAKALSRITTLDKEKIVLLNGIHLDKCNNYTLDNDIETNSVETSIDDLNQLIKKTDNIFDTHYLLVELVPGFHIKIFKNRAREFSLTLVRGTREHNVAGSRTFGFGARKRLQMALLPIMYKLGVITTLLIGLTVLTLKALTIGVILLILAFGGIFTKIKAVPWDEGHSHHKDVHIHVHPFAGGKYPGYWKTWQRQEDIDTASSNDVSVHHPRSPQLEQPYHHHFSIPGSSSLTGPAGPGGGSSGGESGSASRPPYSFFPPSVSGLID